MKIESSDLPDLGDEKGIFAFAMTFNGYEAFGSFDAAAKSAVQQRRESLDDVRNELFMAARASRHGDSDAYLAKYEELLPHLTRFLSK
ncbi:hypothetical protein [Massilia agri]|uniref:Uncharacterized protein n=1 Tax=Massilia agri TaxID=1886785 RepID=A0ABT2AS26_9BURK|nr:hypothetical protein [Massilia agri]MCS0599052.1 hypothetical protein [Massilia agri]